MPTPGGDQFGSLPILCAALTEEEATTFTRDAMAQNRFLAVEKV